MQKNVTYFIATGNTYIFKSSMSVFNWSVNVGEKTILSGGGGEGTLICIIRSDPFLPSLKLTVRP